MSQSIIKSFIKITILSLVFIVLFQIWNQVINAWWWSSEEKTTNSDTFQSIDNYWFSEIWVALNINIWTKFYEWKKDTTNYLYNEIIPISIIQSDRAKTNEVLIKKNLDAIKDYINIVKVDPKSYLDSLSDRKESYDSLMNQLKIRYKTWYANSKNLGVQIDTLTSYLEQLDNSINNTKQSIALNMKNYNTTWLGKNIDDFITFKNDYNSVRVYLIFCNRFQAYYTFLNNYNRQTITTLRLNEDAIIKNTHIVIPNSWSNLIIKLNLLYEEWSLPQDMLINQQTTNIDTTTIDNSSLEYNTDTSINNNTIGNSSLEFNTDTSINNNYNWIFWDPFNLEDNNTLDSTKQTWKINFGWLK
jgi:hypothetical protein